MAEMLQEIQERTRERKVGEGRTVIERIIRTALNPKKTDLLEEKTARYRQSRMAGARN